ncbi:hypothetical protein LINPERPRIM_LOCUS13503 [Linum perenne]
MFEFYISDHKYEIVKRLQAMKHLCGITGEGFVKASGYVDHQSEAKAYQDILVLEGSIRVSHGKRVVNRARHWCFVLEEGYQQNSVAHSEPG